MKFDPSKQLSENKLKDLLAYIQGSGGSVILSKHAKERMQQRGYSLRDIMYIIANGSLADSEFNDAFANWKYTFKGEDLEGTEGGVVFSVGRHYQCIIITVLS